MLQRTNCGKKGRQERSNLGGKTGRRKEEKKKNHGRIIYSYLGYWQYWNKINFDEFITWPNLHQSSIPRGFRVRVRVRNPNPTQFPWDQLPWQPIVYSLSDWSSAPTGMQPIVSRLMMQFGQQFLSVTRPFQELKLYLELPLWEKSSYALRRWANCTMSLIELKKNTEVTVILIRLFLHIHEVVQASQTKR